MIDWSRISELRKEIGEDDFIEVVEMFLEEVDEIVERLFHSPEPILFEQDMHCLKGSALNLGFFELSKICARNEKIARAGKPEDVDPAEVIRIYKSSKSKLLSSVRTQVAA